MKYTTRISVALAALMLGTALPNATWGDDNEQRMEELEQELREIDATLKPGDEVVALQNLKLKVGKKVVATARKGAKLSVEQVQDNWLWVRSGQTHGWVDSRSVIKSQLLDWYKRLPDNSSVEQSEKSRAKYDGMLFEIVGAGQRGSVANSFQDATYNGTALRGPFSATTYSNLGIIVRGRGDRRELALCLTGGRPLGGPFSGAFEAALRAKSYGTVEQGDYVFINPKTRLVRVNGERRRLR